MANNSAFSAALQQITQSSGGQQSGQPSSSGAVNAAIQKAQGTFSPASTNNPYAKIYGGSQYGIVPVSAYGQNKSLTPQQPAYNNYLNRYNGYLSSGKSDYTTSRNLFNEALQNLNTATTTKGKQFWSDAVNKTRNLYNADNRTTYKNLYDELADLQKTEQELKRNQENANRIAFVSNAAESGSTANLKQAFEYGSQLKQNQSRQKELNALLSQLDSDIESVNMTDDVKAAIDRLTENNYAGRLRPQAQGAMQKKQDQDLVNNWRNSLGLESKYFNLQDRVQGTAKAGLETVGSGFLGAGAYLSRLADYGSGIDQVEGWENAGYATDAVSAANIGASNFEQNRADYTKNWDANGGNGTVAMDTAKYLEKVADNWSDSSAKELSMAKADLGKFGQFMVDAGHTVMTIGADMALAPVTGGSSLVPMFVRVFGESANEARRKGASIGQQGTYALTNAAIETVSEKMFGAFDKLGYGKGFLPVGGLEDTLTKMAKSDVGKYLVKGLYQSAEEGAEEVFADLVAPFANWIIDEQSRGHYFSEIESSELFRDFLLGSALGCLGSVAGTGQTIGDIRQGNLAALAEASRAQARGEQLTPEQQMRLEKGNQYGGLSLKDAGDLRRGMTKEEAKAQKAEAKQQKADEKASKKEQRAEDLRAAFESQANQTKEVQEREPGKHEATPNPDASLARMFDEYEQRKMPETKTSQPSSESVYIPEHKSNGVYKPKHNSGIPSQETPGYEGRHVKGNTPGGKNVATSDIIQEAKEGAFDVSPEAGKNEGANRSASNSFLGKAFDSAEAARQKAKENAGKEAPKAGLKYEDTSKGRKETRAKNKAESEASESAVTVNKEAINEAGRVMQNQVRKDLYKRTGTARKILKNGGTLSDAQKLTKAEAREAVSKGWITEEQAKQATFSDSAAKAQGKEAGRAAEDARVLASRKVLRLRQMMARGVEIKASDKLTRSEYTSAVEAGLISSKEAKSFRQTKAEAAQLKAEAEQAKSNEGKIEGEETAESIEKRLNLPKGGKKHRKEAHDNAVLTRALERGYNYGEEESPEESPKQENTPKEENQPPQNNSSPEQHIRGQEAPPPIEEPPASSEPEESVKPSRKDPRDMTADEMKSAIEKGEFSDEDFEKVFDSTKAKAEYAKAMGLEKSDDNTILGSWYVWRAGNQMLAEDKAKKNAEAEAKKNDLGRELTEVYSRGGLTPNDYARQMVANGAWTQQQANDFLGKQNKDQRGNEPPKSKGKKGKADSWRKELDKLYSEGQISAGEYYNRLAGRGVMTKDEAKQATIKAKAEAAKQQNKADDQAIQSLLEDDPNKKWERQKKTALGKVKKYINEAVSSAEKSVFFEDRPNTRDPEFRDFWAKRSGVDVRRVSLAQLRRMENASRENPMYFTTTLTDDHPRYKIGVRHEVWKYDGGTLVGLRLGENGEIVDNPIIISPEQFEIQARYINGMENAKSYKTDPALGQSFFGEAGANPADTTSAEIRSNAGNVLGEVRENDGGEEETGGRYDEPPLREAATEKDKSERKDTLVNLITKDKISKEEAKQAAVDMGLGWTDQEFNSFYNFYSTLDAQAGEMTTDDFEERNAALEKARQQILSNAQNQPPAQPASNPQTAQSQQTPPISNQPSASTQPQSPQSNQTPPPSAQPSSIKKNVTSAVKDQVYTKDAGKNMEAGQAFQWGKYDSATAEEVSRAADYRISQAGADAERTRLLESDNWDRTDYAEAQRLIVDFSMKLNAKMVNNKILTGEEYQAERYYIDELMEKYRQMKSEAGQKLQQKYKISIADEIRMRAAHRFLNYSPKGDGRVFGGNRYSGVYRTIDNLLKAADKAVANNDVSNMIKVIEDASYIRGNQAMFGNLGVTGEHAGLEFLKDKGMTAEDMSNLLYGNINRMIDDFDSVRPLNMVQNFRTLNLLSTLRTANNNLFNNAAGMRIGAAAQNIGYLAAKQFEAATGKKVAIKDSSITRLKNGTLGAEATAFVNAALMAYYGVNVENGRLDIDNVAKFNPTGNFFERLGARYAFLVNTFVMNPDQMGKARIEKGLQAGIEEAFKDVDMTPEMKANKAELEGYKEYEKNRRLVQADNSTVKLVQHFKEWLNRAKIGNKDLGYIKAGDFFMPFAKVPVNIVQQRIAATPYGAIYHLLSAAKGYHDAVKMHNDVVAGVEGAKEMSAKDMAKYSMNVGRAATTGGMLAIGAVAAMTGALKDFGNDDDDDDEAKIWKNRGYDGLTLNISAMLELRSEWKPDDWVVGAGFLEIFAAPLAIGALAWESHAEGMSVLEATKYATIRSFTDVLDAIADIPGMQAASQMYEAYTYAPAGDANLSKAWTAVRQYLANAASGYVMPNAFTQMSAGIDNTMRNPYVADNAWQQSYQIFANKIPFLRRTLPAKLDLWGNPRKYAENKFMAFMNKTVLPGAVRQIKSDKYEDEIIRLSQAGYKNMLPVTSVPHKIEVGENKYELNKEETIAYEAAYKERYREYRDDFMDSDLYQQLDDAQRVGVLKELKLDAGRKTKQEFLESVNAPDSITMDKWETELEYEDQLDFLGAKQIASTVWSKDENSVSDFEGMDKFINDIYSNISEPVQTLLNNSYSHLDDIYEANRVGINSERWQKAYNIYRYWSDSDAKANLENEVKMWSQIRNEINATDYEMNYLEEHMQLHFQGTPNSDQYYEYLNDAGLTRDEATNMVKAIANLSIQEGYSDVQQNQKYLAVCDNTPKDKQWAAFWTLVPSNASKNKVKKLQQYQGEGIDLRTALRSVGWSEIKGKSLQSNGKWKYWTISK